MIRASLLLFPHLVFPAPSFCAEPTPLPVIIVCKRNRYSLPRQLACISSSQKRPFPFSLSYMTASHSRRAVTPSIEPPPFRSPPLWTDRCTFFFRQFCPCGFTLRLRPPTMKMTAHVVCNPQFYGPFRFVSPPLLKNYLLQSAARLFTHVELL